MTAPAQSFAHDGSDVGVLVCHGFTGDTGSMQPWADRLVEAGFTVRLPLLPGHGTRWQDMNSTTFDDWLATVTGSLADLAERCRLVFVCGLSMGGTLALRLAELHPETVTGLVLVNPSVFTLRKDARLAPVIKYLVPSRPGITGSIAKPGVVEPGYTRVPVKAFDSLRRAWKVVRGQLGRVTAPLLLLHSAHDPVVEPANSAAVLAEVSSTDVTEIVLEKSWHVATLDHDADLIFDESIAFITRLST